MNRKISFSESINEAIYLSMKNDKDVVLLGLGVDDPKGVFGTTLNLHKKFPNRVFDMPTSENSMAGFALGLSISKMKPIIVHQRVEFSLLSIEQIFNQISKWYFMTAGKVNVPMVIRLIIGKGWGQGPQHSQSLETIFSHIPGLKIVVPSNAYEAKGLLLQSIRDPNPVIFFEHRWLHNTFSNVPKKKYFINFPNSSYVNKGNNITLVSFSYSTLECIKATKILNNNRIGVDHVNLKTLNPLDTSKFLKSAKKTKKVLIVDNGMTNYGVSSEISAIISEKIKEKINIKRIGTINSPIPSSPALALHCYPSVKEIIRNVLLLLKSNKKINVKKQEIYGSDQPDKNFKGPF